MQNGLAGRLLELLAGDGSRPLGELARQLDVSQELVRLMAEDLARRGYLAARADGCTTCQGCALAAACGTRRQNGTAMLWMLTEKGHRIANHERDSWHMPDQQSQA